MQMLLRGGIKSLIRAATVEGLATLSKDHRMLDVMDQLIDLAIGWTDTPDKLHTNIKEHIQSSIASLSIIAELQVSDPDIKESRDNFLARLSADITLFSEKEHRRVVKLEERLVASETGLLKTNRARNLAAQMLNEKMAGNRLPQDIINFLQGPWYDSLQLILVRRGTQSEDWFRATKLTETLIWTLEFNIQQHDFPSAAVDDSETVNIVMTDDTAPNQESDAPEPEGLINGSSAAEQPDPSAIKEQQKLYRIIEHLPDELKELLVSLEYQDGSKNTELAAIESAHVGVMTGKPLEKCTTLRCRTAG